VVALHAAGIGADADGQVVMNGPRDSLDWDRIMWRDEEQRVQTATAAYLHGE
jgi:hypothetical protein